MANAAIRLYKGSDTDKRVGINIVNTAFTSTGLTGDTAIPAVLTVNDNWSGTKGIGITFPNTSNSTPELRGLIDINRIVSYGGKIRFTEFNENSNGGLSGGKEIYSLPLPEQKNNTSIEEYTILTSKNFDDYQNNLIYNGGPEIVNNFQGALGFPSSSTGGGWSFSNQESAAEPAIYDTHIDSNDYTYIHENDIQIRFLNNTTSFTQIIHYGLANSLLVNGVDFKPLLDADVFTIAFDYKTTDPIDIWVRLYARENEGDSYCEMADDPNATGRRLNTQTTWKRVSYTFTLSATGRSLIEAIPQIYTASFGIKIKNTVNNTKVNIRHISLYPGLCSLYHTNISTKKLAVYGSWYTSIRNCINTNFSCINNRSNDYFYPIGVTLTYGGAWTIGSRGSGSRFCFGFMTRDNLNNGTSRIETFYLPPPQLDQSQPGSAGDYVIYTSKNITCGTADPSGGNSGDIYIKYV